MANEYIFQTEQILFKHEVSENLPCNTYSMHMHNAYELICFLDGDATHVIEDRKYKLKKGALILIRPRQYHFIQIDSVSRYERYNILFDTVKHRVEGLDRISAEQEIIRLEEDSIPMQILRKCEFYHGLCDGETFTSLASHLLSELFFNLHLFPTLPSKEISPLSPLISKALSYINENLCTIRDIEELAGHLFVSESYLFRLFKRELKQSPKKYITTKRLLAAQKRIADGESPTKVYEACGFNDYTAFYRNYKEFFGHAPSQGNSATNPFLDDHSMQS